jgi:hypothetical protein
MLMNYSLKKVGVFVLTIVFAGVCNNIFAGEWEKPWSSVKETAVKRCAEALKNSLWKSEAECMENEQVCYGKMQGNFGMPSTVAKEAKDRCERMIFNDFCSQARCMEYSDKGKSAVVEAGRDGRFIVHDAFTYLDKQTNLMWPSQDNGYPVNWQSAKEFCEKWRGGGFMDWRLPTLDELATLYDSSASSPAQCWQRESIHVAGRIGITCLLVWTSETRDSKAAVFSFGSGYHQWVSQSERAIHRALPVRSGK